jgi:hypothetical protein
MLPDALPAGIPSGTLDTPLGPARWVHLSGGPSTLPDPLTPMIGRDGRLVWFDPGWTGSPRLWTSDDTLSIRSEHPLPTTERGAWLGLEGDTYWLTTDAPPALWRSDDLEAWDPIDLAGLPPPPTGPAWDASLGVPVTSRGVSLVPITYTARDPGALVGFPGRSVSLKETGPGLYDVVGYHMARGNGPDRRVATTIGTVGVAGTPTGIRFTGPDGGTIAEVGGVGLDFVDDWIAHGLVQNQLGIIAGSALTALVEPQLPITGPHGEPPTLFPVEDGFLAFPIGTDGTVRAWRSADGRSWIAGDLLLDADGRPLHADWVGADWTGGAHELTITPSDGSSETWRSTDGVTWTTEPVPDPEAGSVFRFPSGSLRLSYDGSWSASIDGRTWVEVPALREVVTKWEPANGGSAGGGVIGDAVFFSVEEDEGDRQRDLWIVEIGS